MDDSHEVLASRAAAEQVRLVARSHDKDQFEITADVHEVREQILAAASALLDYCREHAIEHRDIDTLRRYG